ncbi:MULTISPECIES: flavin-containing monooxygenase [Mycobacteriaceae]|uniref:FAD-containing monooxygenase EthA n=1 Tax=Mycolicibacterium neoaurum VKM Ac-1815D TaxID=700508 RepID=V5XHM1_MYCNE|nr:MULTISPECIES: NAD(P)/FAD-dependent oxidoreductase [Mycobacteriaceae]AMO07187.1 FAD-containing monooxygenase EthA [Mycolicibacterium neoaurum]AXK74434.1 NAD(P)/FAD-dependent oxidoreductase [Mycolicibacterium neoaurum]KUM07046.1 FAD-containing monooxygenase EthA [Mycolicibacterium neoaurum]WBP94804.1 NAD(P)/FAD-dependent oxidoreductase [Mycolicibacterium neoaurum]WBS08895.1 NAD(P)/FAD-dependent oxidoreductase [Mycolicibacterium neoaurum]
MDTVDVLIVGAGISGIGAAYYLQREHPGRDYTILEAREATGGTWDLFRYPGIRSDSDLHTFGYEFKPWRDEYAIATADKILAYLRETVDENGIAQRIRFGHKVLAAAWSSADGRWVVDVERDGELIQIGARWLFCAGGYYRYDQGYTPDFAGRDRFGGRIIHPQHWPQDLDYTGKRVVVIGSGATAVTLVPAMAARAEHVTMLQRSPTYVMPVPAKDTFANIARRVLGDDRGYALARRKNILKQRAVYTFCQQHPVLARRLIRRINASKLPGGYPVDQHFNPAYDPWDQRLCAVPDGDLFAAISDGSASVVTDRIATFTETGIRLESGAELAADIIVTATGLNIQLFGGVTLTVDGEPVDLAETVAYKGIMLSGVPNFAFAFGYTNSSWTLKVGLLCEHFCRLLSHMDAQGVDQVRPVFTDPAMPTLPLLDFAAGYVQRVIDRLPRQGTRGPWQMTMNYTVDAQVLRNGPVVDDCLRFSRTPAGSAPAVPDPAVAAGARPTAAR